MSRFDNKQWADAGLLPPYQLRQHVHSNFGPSALEPHDFLEPEGRVKMQ